MRHRTLVFCTDDLKPYWGWWCRDCPASVPAWTTRTRTITDDAKAHEEESETRQCATVS